MPVYWTCFAYEDHGPQDLHCTHKYLGEQTPENLSEITKQIDWYFLSFYTHAITLNFNKIDWFDHLRVLLPSEPVRLFPLLRGWLAAYRKDDFPYNPHVTCYTEDEINKPFTRYCLMNHNEIVREWRLG